MRKIEFKIDKGYPWGEKTEIFEFDDDDITDDEIQEQFVDWVLSNTVCEWRDVSDE